MPAQALDGPIIPKHERAAANGEEHLEVPSEDEMLMAARYYETAQRLARLKEKIS